MIRELQESCLLKLLTRWLVTHSKQSTMKNGFSVKLTVILRDRRPPQLAVLDTGFRDSFIPLTYLVTGNYRPTVIVYASVVRTTFFREAIETLRKKAKCIFAAVLRWSTANVLGFLVKNNSSCL